MILLSTNVGEEIFEKCSHFYFAINFLSVYFFDAPCSLPWICHCPATLVTDLPTNNGTSVLAQQNSTVMAEQQHSSLMDGQSGGFRISFMQGSMAAGPLLSTTGGFSPPVRAPPAPAPLLPVAPPTVLHSATCHSQELWAWPWQC